jgi:hypothetical protein
MKPILFCCVLAAVFASCSPTTNQSTAKNADVGKSNSDFEFQLVNCTSALQSGQVFSKEKALKPRLSNPQSFSLAPQSLSTIKLTGSNTINVDIVLNDKEIDSNLSIVDLYDAKLAVYILYGEGSTFKKGFFRTNDLEQPNAPKKDSVAELCDPNSLGASRTR